MSFNGRYSRISAVKFRRCQQKEIYGIFKLAEFYLTEDNITEVADFSAACWII